MENELNFDRHYYLYAKGHYKTTEFVRDLKIITGSRCGIDPKFETLRDICSILLSLVMPQVVKSEHHFKEFMQDINPAKRWMWGERKKDAYTGEECMGAVVHKCLSVLALTEVKDIPFELGKADPKVLPLIKEQKKDERVCLKVRNKS